jgi:hypothetical protein
LSSFVKLSHTRPWTESKRSQIVLYRVSLFVCLPLDKSGMSDPTSSYATAGIALRVSRELKPHHHDKVETPSVGINR